jgi:uncharacterized protein
MHAITSFPHFTPLAIHHQQIIEEITRHFPSYSDFNFISLFTWDTDASIAVAMFNQNLIVRFSDYDDGSIFLSLIGTHELGKTIPSLFDYCKQEALPMELRLVPQSVADALPHALHEHYTVTESRDNHDYILSVKKLSALGAEYQRKRKAVNRFTNRYGEAAGDSLIDLGDPQSIAQIQEVMEQWRLSRHRDNEQDNKEFIAIHRTLRHAKELGVRAYGLYLDNRLVAFTLFEVAPQKDVAIFHYTKADATIEGVFEYLKYCLAKHLGRLGIEYINIEQDLGVEGLRTAKESYKPVYFLKKFTIAPKGQT